MTVDPLVQVGENNQPPYKSSKSLNLKDIKTNVYWSVTPAHLHYYSGIAFVRQLLPALRCKITVGLLLWLYCGALTRV